MGWEPGLDGGTGATPDRDPGLPGGVLPVRDPRLAGFAADGSPDLLPPSGRLALLADELSGPDRRCPGATEDELTGLLRTWTAIESWAAGAKLGVIRELMRREGVPSAGCDHGDLPEAWSPSLRYELAAALACSTQSAETTAWLAWEQQARLPGIGALLDGGILTHAKARVVVDTFRYLTDSDAATAERLILDQLAGKTYTQVLRLAEQAALTVDPELAERRREQAQRKDARVSFLREQAGTAALSGRDLPPDEALAAMANVNTRADEYKNSDAFGDTRMDVLRAYAYLDLLNNVPAEARIACPEAQDESAEAAEALAWAEARSAAQAGPGGTPFAAKAGTVDTTDDRDGDGSDGSDGPGASASDHGESSGDSDGSAGGDDDQPGDGPASSGLDGGSPGSGASGPGLDPDTAVQASERRPADLIVPLATLLGLAERPGEIQGFGLLDPALARELAAAAATSTRTEVCVTVTTPEGYAIGHGCARPDQKRPGLQEPEAATSLTWLPARLNLTIPATALAGLANQDGPWDFSPRAAPDSPGSPGPPDGYGTWTLTLPGGRRFTVRLDLVPTFECDHRYETHGYQPSGKLRHLVQVRDGTCTFPSCNRHARESDWEHAIPYDQGGRTCSCNGGARSRACHRVKQSPAWNVTQPRPGWHQWQTPSGRTYVQEPKRYPS